MGRQILNALQDELQMSMTPQTAIDMLSSMNTGSNQGEINFDDF